MSTAPLHQRNVGLMRGIAFLIFVALAPAAARAQVAADALASALRSSKPADMPAGVRRVIAAAPAAPAMFASDVLLKAVASLSSSAVDQRKGLLDTAWQDAQDVQDPYPMVTTAAYHLEGVATDRTYVSGLDRLSLESRVVLGMVNVDPATALRLYRSISVADLPMQAGCDAEHLADPSIYYDAGEAILAAQPAGTIKLEQLSQLMQAANGEMSVSPVLRLVTKAGKLSPEQQTAVSLMLARMLDRIRGDDLAFTRSNAAVDADMPLVLQLLPAGAKSTQRLKQSFRSYFQAHYTAMRCQADIDSEAFAQEQQNLQHQMRDLELTERDNRPAGLLPATAAITPESKDQPGERYYAEVWDFVKSILDEHPSTQLNDRQKTALDNLLADVTNAGSQDDDQFHLYKNRCGALRQLITMLPVGEQREKVGYAYAQLLAASPVYKADPVDWFYDVRWLLQDVEGMAPVERTRFRGMLHNSGNPVLDLYAELDKELRETSNRTDIAAELRAPEQK